MIFIGIVLSFGIEISQLILRVGFTELDDVIANTVGTMVGAGMVAGVRKVVAERSSV